MFCASLRKRPEWAGAPAVLLRKEKRAWKESRMDSHDIAIPLPGVGSNDSDNSPHLLFILLSALDVSQPATQQRISRLFHLDGGRRCAVVFLLATGGDSDGLSAIGRLQIELTEQSITMPLLPLVSIDNLPFLLEVFYTKFVSPSSRRPRPPASEALALLPYCAAPNPPLPERDANILGDINTGFADLFDKVATPEGREILRDYVEDSAERVIRFWTVEFCE